MRFFIYTFFALALPATVSAQAFSDLIVKVHAAPQNRQQYLVDSFLTTIGSYPLIEGDSTVFMLYKGEAQKVLLASDANAWSNTRSPLARLASTDLWYRKELFEPDARIDYKLIVGEQWILDPNNPHTAPSGYGPNSELRMPSYTPPPEIVEQNSIPHGTIQQRSFYSPLLNNSRSASIYLPAGYMASVERYPLVLFHDGNDYLNLANAVTVLDNLIASRRIPPVIAVFLPPVNRTEEYTGGQIAVYSHFVVNTVLSTIDSEYRTRTDSEARAVVGTSNGGHLALYQGMLHPSVFGHVGAQSSNVTPLIIQGYAAISSPAGKTYLDLGTYDIDIIISRVQSFIPTLQQGGFDFLYREFHEGHSWGNWRAHIDDMLEYFFSGLIDVEEIEASPSRGMIVHPPAPNPARTQSTLRAEFSHARDVDLRLYDGSGRLMKELWHGHCTAGEHSFSIDTSNLRPGLYFLSLHSSTGMYTQRLLVL